MFKTLNSTKKIKLQHFLFPNLFVFIIKLFKKNSEFQKYSAVLLVRIKLATENEILSLSKTKKIKKLTNN